LGEDLPEPESVGNHFPDPTRTPISGRRAGFCDDCVDLRGESLHIGGQEISFVAAAQTLGVKPECRERCS
jgi:hypothetical protein